MILAGRFVVSLDRIRVATPGIASGHIEWNCPGEVTDRPGGFRVEQQGIFFEVASASGWPTARGVSDQSNDWKGTLESGAYPHAKWPLKKLRHQLPSVAAGNSHLAVLLAANRTAEPRYRITEPQRGVIRIEAMEGDLPAVSLADQDLSIRGGDRALEIQFAATPELPAPLKAWAAK
jgi:hypothetical protein